MDKKSVLFGAFIILLQLGHCSSFRSSALNQQINSNINRTHRITKKGFGFRVVLPKNISNVCKLSSKTSDDLDQLKKDESNRITEEDFANFKDLSDLSSEELQEFDATSPPMGIVLSQILGINAFTYILAALIVIFLTLNSVLGPGWLGQKLGIEGTGEYTEYGTSIPKPVDLKYPENLL